MSRYVSQTETRVGIQSFSHNAAKRLIWTEFAKNNTLIGGHDLSNMTAISKATYHLISRQERRHQQPLNKQMRRHPVSCQQPNITNSHVITQQETRNHRHNQPLLQSKQLSQPTCSTDNLFSLRSTRQIISFNDFAKEIVFIIIRILSEHNFKPSEMKGWSVKRSYECCDLTVKPQFFL